MFEFIGFTLQDKQDLITDIFRLCIVLVVVHMLQSTLTDSEVLFNVNFLNSLIFWILGTIVYYLISRSVIKSAKQKKDHDVIF
jgi:hypothetical protein